MRFLIDNQLAPQIALQLVRAGHDALHVRERGMQKADDPAILALAANEERIVVSADTDFGTLLALRQERFPSLVLLRRCSHIPDSQASLLLVNLPAIEQDLARGCIAVFDEKRIRIRMLPIISTEE